MHNHDFSVFNAFACSPHLFTNQKTSSRNSSLKMKLNSQLIFLYHLCLFFKLSHSFLHELAKTNKQTTQKELVGRTAWRLLLCLDSTSSSERRTKEEAEAERGSCWFTMDRVAVNINNGEEQRTTRGDGIQSPPQHRPESELIFRVLYSTEPTVLYVHCHCRNSFCYRCNYSISI